jgi:hypothetical protein
MNSNNGNRNQQEQQQQQQQPRVCFQDYIHYSDDFQGNGTVSHHWKYAAAADTADPLLTLRQYYDLEEKHCPRKDARGEFKHIATALPRHFAVVAATRQPRQFISRTESCVMTLQNTPTQHKIQSLARARVHDESDITIFTELTLHQRVIVVARTGIAHLLVKKLAGIFWTERHMHQAVLTFADLVASFISSALACEYLVGNRYYRNLPTILATEAQVVGCPHGRHHQITAEDVTPAKIQETKQELQVLYAANIDRLEAAIDQYKRGFVSLESLRTDPEFVKMFSKFWRLSFQTMKARSCSESRIAARRTRNPAPLTPEESAERLLMCREIFNAQCQFSRLIQYRIAHLFDNSIFGYVSLLRSAKSSQLRLCNDGLVAGLLTFATIEPRLITPNLAPDVSIEYISCDLAGAANHVQSRDPVFGEILAKHRQHIPTTKESYTPVSIWRSTLSGTPSKTYHPIQSRLDSIWAGERLCLTKPERRGPPPPIHNANESSS